MKIEKGVLKMNFDVIDDIIDMTDGDVDNLDSGD